MPAMQSLTRKDLIATYIQIVVLNVNSCVGRVSEISNQEVKNESQRT